MEFVTAYNIGDTVWVKNVGVTIDEPCAMCGHTSTVTKMDTVQGVIQSISCHSQGGPQAGINYTVMLPNGNQMTVSEMQLAATEEVAVEALPEIYKTLRANAVAKEPLEEPIKEIGKL